MKSWANISYRAFYDVPRIFLVPSGTLFIYSGCPFDDDLDDYPEAYTRCMPFPLLTPQELEGDWEKAFASLAGFPGRGSRAQRFVFDPSLRKSIDTGDY